MRGSLKVILIITVVFFVFGQGSLGHAAGIEPERPSAGWLATIQENIAREEYHLSWQETTVLPDLEASWHAPNRVHDLRTYFTENGIRVVRRTEAEPTWEWSMSLLRIGRPGALREVQPAVLSTRENRIDYERKGRVELLEWYVNDERGIEQGFTIPRRPEEEGDRLYIDIAVGGSLYAVLAEDRQSFDFRNAGGERLIHYGHLKVTDATGEILDSWMEGFSGAQANGIRLVIEDAGARYPLDVDPLATSPCWSKGGTQEEEYFGYAVAAAGDVNGDGFGDVVVGSPWFDGGSANNGRVHAFYGNGSGLPINANWSSTMDQAGAVLGYSLSTAGDVNGDGYSDVVAGMPSYRSGSPYYEGAFVLYQGSATGLDNGLIIQPEPTPSGDLQTGYSVSTAGDVNGDGYSDVIVGGPAQAKAWVYHGSAGGLTLAWTVEKTVVHPEVKYHFGRSVGLAGDVNGDGYSDVIIGWPYNGSAHVWHGSPSGLSSPSSADWDGSGGGFFGWSVGTAGDVDGNGISDVIIGAPGGEGRAYVYEGSIVGLLGTESWYAEGNQAGAEFGISVHTAGDVNGDGYSDVIVGAHLYDNGQADEGRAFVYHGSASGLHILPDWTMDGDYSLGRFGRSVATAGDVNGDGYSDVIIGKPYYHGGLPNRGAAYVYLGGAAGLETVASWSRESGQAYAYFGMSVSTAGDVNRDGHDDVIVGIPDYDNGQPQEGRFYVYFGNENGVNSSWADYRESQQTGARLGDAVAAAGDIDGDGYGDIIVGAPGYDNIQTDEGRVYVYTGNATGVTYHWRAESNDAGADMGEAVAGAGDVNGDGYADIIIGAPGMGAPTHAEGAAYVWLGSAAGLGDLGIPGNADWSVESNVAFNNMGSSVASAGDVNGDGYSDVIVGCVYCDGDQVAEGKAFVWHGSPLGLGDDGVPGNADWSAEWDQEESHLGRSVASAGDVNNDGYSDVIVGGPYWDNGAYINAGRVSIYHGSAAGLLAEPQLNWICKQDGENCGFSVTGLGDTNGDGYSDVAFGAPNHDYNYYGEGRAVVLLGSATGIDEMTAVHYRGGQAGAQMGKSVSSAGDVNADGYADMIVGAPFFDNGQTDEGRAYVFLGNQGVARSALPRQRTTVGIAIPRLGRSNITDGVNLAVTARGFLGRGQVTMEKEFKPTGEIMWGWDTIISPTWLDSDYAGVTYGSTTFGLESSHLYHWRLRVRQHPTTSPYQLWGRWFTRPWGGRNEGMFRLWSDGDGDGFDDNGDNCPDDYNPGQEDQDDDGVGDHCDNCISTWNPGQENGDPDGIGDACDTCTDADGDGYGAGLPAELCPVDNCPDVYNSDQTDTDTDGEGDACDTCTDTDDDGYGDPDFPSNTCADDNCPYTSNPGQENNDGDAEGDACDPDDDNDSVPDGSDNCPFIDNPGQENNDGDAEGDACDPDDDNDTVDDGSDNCPFDHNPGQEDYDLDGMGDACDPDDDDDGALDGDDCLPLDADTWSIPSEALNLAVSKATTNNLSWNAAADPGTVHMILYDVLLSTNPAGWGYDTTDCVESDDADLFATETSEPLPGNGYYYLVRAQNDCGGNMGEATGGAPRNGRGCP